MIVIRFNVTSHPLSLFLLAQLKLDETVTEGFCLRTQPIAAPIVQNLLVGEYSLFWRRYFLCSSSSSSSFDV